jgi:hypothetical protein
VWLGAVAASVLIAKANVDRGVDRANDAIFAAGRADSEGAGARLSEAAAEFRAARADLGVPWLGPLRVLPGARENLAATRQLAALGARLMEAGRRTTEAAKLDGIRPRGGAVDLVAVGAIRHTLAQSLDELERTRRDVTAIPRRRLVPPVRSQLTRFVDRIDGAVPRAREAVDTVDAVTGFLGGSGRRRYFLALQNPAELRAAGGIISSYGVLAADGGRLSLESVGRVEDLSRRPGEKARTLSGPAGYLARYGRFGPEQAWQNITMSPDFPSVASVIEELYPQTGGGQLDGVISVDPAALAIVLSVTGAVTPAGWPEPITAANAEAVLLHEQYLRYPTDHVARVAFLGSAVRATFDRLLTANLPPPRQLIDRFAPAARARHIQLQSTNDLEQRTFERLRIAGSFDPLPDADALAVVMQDASGSKIDWFARRSTTYRAVVDPRTGSVRSTLEVAIQNTAPASGLPAYVIDPSPGAATHPGRGTNRIYLGVYTKLRVTSAERDGAAMMTSKEPEQGWNGSFSFQNIAPGATAVFRFYLEGTAPMMPTYRLAVRSQVLPTPERFTLDVSWPGGSQHRSRVLKSDAVFDVKVTGGVRGG